MAAISPDDQARRDVMGMTCVIYGAHPHDTIAFLHQRNDPRTFAHLRTRSRGRILEQSIEPPAPRAVLGTSVSEQHVHERIVLRDAQRP
jgi:hypothetical protein